MSENKITIGKNIKGDSDTISIVLISTAIIHLIILIINYKNDLLTIGNNLNVHSFDNLLSLLLKIVDLINLSWFMVIWCLVLGVVYKYVKDKDDKTEIGLT